MTNKMPADEILMAYADGMLPSEDARHIEALANSDSQIAGRIDMFRQSARLAQEALAPLAAEKVPDALLSTIQKQTARRNHDAEPNVVSLAQKRQERQPYAQGQPSSWKPAAIAACLVATLAAGYLVGRQQEMPAQLAAGAAVPPAISAVLNSAASGQVTQVDGGSLKIISTFKLEGNSLCREFESDRVDGTIVVAVACRQGAIWSNRMAVSVVSGNDGFAPASSVVAVDAYLEAIGAGTPLTDAAEARELTAR